MSVDSIQGRSLRKPFFDSRMQNCVALIVIFLFFGYVFCCLPTGVGLFDEAHYYSVVKRFAEGDRVFTDDWTFAQLFTVLLIIPYKIYVWIVGSTDGIILFMRYLYAATELILCVHIYRKLRRYGMIALIYALLLFTLNPMLTFSYYKIAVNCIALVLVELFAGDGPPSRRKLVLLGIIVSCAVLAQPVLAVCYFAYTGQVLFLRLIRGRDDAMRAASHVKPGIRTWKYLTLGILIAFAAFMLYFAISCHFDFTALVQNFPEIFHDPRYSFNVSDQYNHFSHYLHKLSQEIVFCGKGNVIAGLLLVAASLIWKLVRKGQIIRTILFVAACGVFFLTYSHMAYVLVFSPDHTYKSLLFNFPLRGFSAPIAVLGLICILLSNKPAPKSVAFWWTSFVVSSFVDVSSQICFSYAGIIVLFPMLVCCREIVSELCDTVAKAVKKGKNRTPGDKGAHFLIAQKHVAGVLVALIALPVLLWGGGLTFIRTQEPRYERFDWPKESWRPLDQTVEFGPLKGIRTTKYFKEYSEKTIKDMALVNQIGNGPFYVPLVSALPYLAVDLPTASYSAWIDEDPNMDRLLRYWELHPDRIPAVIYVPFYDSINYFPRKEEAVHDLAELKKLFDYEMIDGYAGLILKVNQLHSSGTS